MKHLRTLELIADVATSGSIRRTAERLHLTPSALSRKIQDFENELGVPIFERLPQKMQLTTAGEMLIWHIRNQLADFERLRSKIDDLSGIRRGNVRLAVSQAFAGSLIPEQIMNFRTRFPGVTFQVYIRDHEAGVEALTNMEVDLALLVHPPANADVEPLHFFESPICAVMSPQHPLAGEGSIRIWECADYPLVMPSNTSSIRQLLDFGFAKQKLMPQIQVESNSFEMMRSYALHENLIFFQISEGLQKNSNEINIRPISTRDIPNTQVKLCQLYSRSLPVATAKFAQQLINGIENLRKN